MWWKLAATCAASVFGSIRMELGRKQCRIRTPDAEHDKYPRIAQHGRTDVRHDLVGKLMTEAAPRHSLPNLRIQSKGLVWLQLAAVPFMTIVGTVTPVSALLPTAGATCAGYAQSQQHRREPDRKFYRGSG